MKVEKISVLISKKIGTPNYGSVSASYGITVHLDEEEQFIWRDVFRHYDEQVKALVNESLETPKQKQNRSLVQVVKELPFMLRLKSALKGGA